MASRPPGHVAAPEGQPGLFRKPMWEPWGNAPEILDGDGNIVGVGEATGRVRMIAADTTHTGRVKTKLDPTGKPHAELKGFVPLEYAPDEAKVQWHLMRERMIANAAALGVSRDDLARKNPAVVVYAHLAEEGARLLKEQSAKAAKGAPVAA